MTPCYTRHELAPGVHVDIPHEHEGVAVKSMAEVLREHFQVIRYTSHTKAGASDAVQATPEQIEAALTAAGYGPVKAAAAGALRDAAEIRPLDRVCPTCGAKRGNACYGNGPMRKPHPERELSADWLRARAATIEADQ